MGAERIKGPLAAFVNRLLSRIDYATTWSARVVAQNSDGSLELVTDDDRIPNLSRVPVHYGLPGASAEFATDSRVHLVFLNSDPSLPAVTGWEQGAVTKLEIDAGQVVFNGGTKGVARVDDTIDCGTLVFVPLTTLTWTPPGGGAPIVSPPAPIPLIGKITSGSSDVDA